MRKTESIADWRAVGRLLKPYWVSEDWPRAWALLISVIALTLGMVYLEVLFNRWNRDFYNALDTKNFEEFSKQLWRFSYLAFIYIAVFAYRVYLRQMLEMRWRTWMTRQYMQRWLANQAYYRIEQSGAADNADQRIAEDLRLITRDSLFLSLGLLLSVVTLISFVGILWSVSGPLAVMIGSTQLVIPGYMVWFALFYAIAGSLLVIWIGKPLVRQNFDLQRFEADFRFGLVRIRENAEPIALYRGEDQEQARLQGRFEWIRKNWWDVIRTTKRLGITSTFYAQFAVIFPFLVAAPRYFSGAISLGGLTQIASAFGQVQDALSWFIEAFDRLAEWKASINRLAGFHAAVEQAKDQRPGITVSRNNVGAILLEGLSLHLPSGTALTEPFTAQIHPGQRILVTGPSGCGKSTLFRAIAGIWPYGAGEIEVPRNAGLLFLPQRTYLPIGSLRAAICYPAQENAYADLAIRHYLEVCRLSQLCERLDEQDNWSQRLSPGEQQRLAFVRVMLAKPKIMFLDEATSALDAETEEVLYRLLLQESPEAALLSIAHRSSVAEFHQLRWHFAPLQASISDPSAMLQHSLYKIEQSSIGKR